MNKVFLIGNLTKEPNISYTTSSDPLCVCKMTVAVGDGYGDKKQTYFIPVTVFGKQAENCERFLDKGSKVCVSGKIVTGSYEKNGQKVYTTDVIADSIEFLSSKNDWKMP